MPAYLIIHPREQRKDDALIEGDDLRLAVADGWAVFIDQHGICLAIPAGLGAQIQRVDEQQEPDQEPAPQKE
ncbi:hypothetical protein [Streptomyces sp. enrichment culture]|uniref:hypothetical protein n=1 Tax=Streptomyces sp. enrichment culture TaxID=1795815 RepID=UPI003F56CB73